MMESTMRTTHVLCMSVPHLSHWTVRCLSAATIWRQTGHGAGATPAAGEHSLTPGNLAVMRWDVPVARYRRSRHPGGHRERSAATDRQHRRHLPVCTGGLPRLRWAGGANGVQPHRSPVASTHSSTRCVTACAAVRANADRSNSASQALAVR